MLYSREVFKFIFDKLILTFESNYQAQFDHNLVIIYKSILYHNKFNYTKPIISKLKKN